MKTYFNPQKVLWGNSVPHNYIFMNNNFLVISRLLSILDIVSMFFLHSEQFSDFQYVTPVKIQIRKTAGVQSYPYVKLHRQNFQHDFVKICDFIRFTRIPITFDEIEVQS